jgi:paired small multidrug resistance pump
MIEVIADIVGLMGMSSFLLAYLLLQRGKVQHCSALYLSLNLAGALMLMFSLLFKWNLAAFLLEAAWALITLQGMYQHLYLPRRVKQPHADSKQNTSQPTQ